MPHNYTIPQRLRILLGRLPGVKWLYDFLRLTFVPTFREDGLATVNNSDFMRDPQFKQAYTAALQQHASLKNVRWRAHITQWAGFHASQLTGDFVECGVNRGFFSMSLMTYLDFEQFVDRTFYLIDTYCGLVPKQVAPEDHAAFRNYYTDCYDFVRNSFAKFENAKVVRGVVPDVLHTIDFRKVAYLSIDMNCAEPEVAALEHFWPLMESGGIIVLDDYGFPGHEWQKTSADKFAARVDTKILQLPTGQGLLIKN